LPNLTTSHIQNYLALKHYAFPYYTTPLSIYFKVTLSPTTSPIHYYFCPTIQPNVDLSSTPLFFQSSPWKHNHYFSQEYSSLAPLVSISLQTFPFSAEGYILILKCHLAGSDGTSRCNFRWRDCSGCSQV